jgi:hypothetical protein
MNQNDSFLQRFFYWSKDRFPFFNVIVSFAMAFSVKGLFLIDGKFVWTLDDLLLGIIFLTHLFLLRVMDEHKDFESDKKFHPNRAVQQGIIKLSEIRMTGYFALAVQIFSVGILTLRYKNWIFLLVWCFLWVWSLLMLKEFFIKEKLRKNLFLYSFLHLLVSPTLFVLGWVFYSNTNSELNWTKILLLITLSLSTGFMFEITRKNKSPEEDLLGETSFSLIWGRRKSSIVVLLLSLLALSAGLMYVRWQQNFSSVYFVGAVLFFAFMVRTMLQFLSNPTSQTKKKMEKTVEICVAWSVLCSLIIVYVRSIN